MQPKVNKFILQRKIIMAKNKELQPIRPVLEGMGIGASAEYPIERMDVVKSTASILGTKLGRYYSTKTIRDSRIIRVTRLL